EGKAGGQADADRIRRVVAAVLAGTGVELVDLLQIPTPEPPTRKQVLIRARVVEINKTDRADLGVEWIPTQVIPATGTAPATITPLTQPFLFSQIQTGPFENIFNAGGPIARVNPIGARVSALVLLRSARVLAGPNPLLLPR